MSVCAGGCRRAAPPLPTLANALQLHGDAATEAKECLRVTLDGAPSERRRAALMWGIFACEAHAPASALRAFAVAAPTAGLGRLAARRLEESLDASSSPEWLWRAASSTSWLEPDERARVLLRGAERALTRGDRGAALRLLAGAGPLHGDARARMLAVTAQAAAAAAAASARQAVAIEFPQRFAALLPGQSLAATTAALLPAERAEQAQAWLASGQPGVAYGAAIRAGSAGLLVAARAALALRHASDGLHLAERVGAGSAEAWLERAEALRQLAWAGPSGGRAERFRDMWHAAERAGALLPPASPLVGRAELALGEALTELGRFGEAQPHLARPEAGRQPRWEWVAHRFYFLQAQAGVLPAELPPLAAAGSRVRRLGEYWRARYAASHADMSGLTRLAASGFPDLPGLWAAVATGATGVAVETVATPETVPPPPEWARDLMTAGRVADVVFAWRTELERGDGARSGWLGLAALAGLPPLDAIPLLVRGEPRLLAGPWSGLPKDLLARYLPLPWRGDVEAAAARASVPPWLLAALVRQESAWNPKARSAAGAIGLTQLLPPTAAELVRSAGLPPTWARSLSEPRPNLTIGALLLARWRGSLGHSWAAALACYNAGERRMREVWESAGRRDGAEFVEAIELPETWDYVHRVVLLAEGYRVVYWPEGRPYPWT